MTQYIVVFGAAAWMIGIFSYIRDTVISGTTKPNKVTWLMWSIAPLIAAAAAYTAGVRWAALPVFIAGVAPLLVFIASFINPKSYWELGPFDYVCGFLSILALALWWITKEPFIAIILSIASDGFASIPTIIKSWKHPKTESGILYIAALFSALTSFFALKMFDISELAFPIYLVLLNVILIDAIYGERIKKYIRNNPFLSLSFTPTLSFLFILDSAFIVSLLPNASIRTNIRADLLTAYYSYLSILPALVVIGVILTGIGFLRRENKKGLIVSLLLNVIFLYFVLV